VSPFTTANCKKPGRATTVAEVQAGNETGLWEISRARSLIAPLDFPGTLDLKPGVDFFPDYLRCALVLITSNVILHENDHGVLGSHSANASFISPADPGRLMISRRKFTGSPAASSKSTEMAPPIVSWRIFEP
jgi:hypothetical protein